MKKLLAIWALAIPLSLAAQQPSTALAPLLPYVPAHAGMRIFVRGNNEVGVDLRRRLISSECFTVVQNPKQAEAILDVAEDLEASGAQGAWTSYGSATLTASNGDLLWADSKQGTPGILHSGAGSAAESLAWSLFQNAGCKLNGKMK